MKNLFLLLIMPGMLFLSSCSSVSVIGSWSDPEARAIQSDKVMVIGITPKINVRQNVENQMTDKLTENGVNVTGSLTVFPPTLKDADAVEKWLVADGYQMVITLGLLDSEKETRYVPGTVYAPGPYYGFRGYYGGVYGAVYSPGYYETSQVFYIECNAYTLPEGKLVYSSQSKTVNPSSVEKTSYDLASAIVRDMVSRGILPSKK